MTELSDSFKRTDHGAEAPDLPPPPPLSLGSESTLFLDFDGTLVEIAERPDLVVVNPALPPMIAALSDALDGRFALISGRSLAALDHLLGPSEVAMAGSHGGELRAAGSAAIVPLADPLPARAVEEVHRFAAPYEGLVVEPKPFSIAVHYRHHPALLERLLTVAEGVAAKNGLMLKHGKQVIELTMPGSDKGSAVARFMEDAPFAGTQPLFLGDDVTDEEAFRAVTRFGGGGVLVGGARPTAALWRLPDVSAVHRWLAAALA